MRAHDGGMSTMTQWKNSARGRSAGTMRPAWFTSSPTVGARSSTQISTRLRVPSGTPLQERPGLRLSDSRMWVSGSCAPNANRAGIHAPSARSVTVSFIILAPTMRILHTMIRVGDLDASLAFYTDVLGMHLIRRHEY